MSLFALGINHQTASVALREKVAFSPDSLLDAYQQLLAQHNVLEAVIVSTCNRTEIYCHVEQPNCQTVIDWFCAFHNIAESELSKSLYCHHDEQAIQHLFRVSCGLDSLVLGEPQILGQIKQAFATAGQAKSVNKLLNRWFQHAFTVAKRVRTETQIGANAISVAFAAVCLAKQIFSDLSQSRVLLIGAGETIELVGKYLVEHNVPNITIANRTLSRAMDLVEQFDAQAITLGEIPNHLSEADIIISSTASPLPIIGKGMVESALKARRHQPMLFIDIAVPRDIEAQVSELRDAYLYSVDDLHGIIEENKQARQEAAIEAEKIIEGCIVDFCHWLESLKAVESIRNYRTNSELLRDELLSRAMSSLEKGGDAEKVLKELAFKLTNKLIHHPSQALTQVSRSGDDNELQILRSALGLNEE
ncbi:glutamyl-tRNA reductase [Psychromonas sp. Urea-02u-13]|uniref:glutamyl-tRNA reductase n=1 Tax=Psychromonas sp. Urea-02u-13 TaxID=2058326 RepID=UPI000C33F9B0|nr:glutamyl-tRNA reductase [Psychromonas sp. Urea-02u-13]PKG37420.1 glutamyl-tRNA reductase [Psychromonas sp. Urea-02u-13]